MTIPTNPKHCDLRSRLPRLLRILEVLSHQARVGPTPFSNIFTWAVGYLLNPFCPTLQVSPTTRDHPHLQPAENSAPLHTLFPCRVTWNPNTLRVPRALLSSFGNPPFGSCSFTEKCPLGTTLYSGYVRPPSICSAVGDPPQTVPKRLACSAFVSVAEWIGQQKVRTVGLRWTYFLARSVHSSETGEVRMKAAEGAKQGQGNIVMFAHR